MFTHPDIETETSPVSPPSCAQRILIAARGKDAVMLARALLEKGYDVTLRTSPADVLSRLKDTSPVPVLVIIDPLDMANCLPDIAELEPRPAVIAATGDRRPAELIRALQSGLYQGWLAYPMTPEEVLPVIAETLQKRRDTGMEADLARTLLEAANDIMRAARGSMKGTEPEPAADQAIMRGLDIAAAVEDVQALMTGALYFRPAFRTVQTLLRPVVATWVCDASSIDVSVEFAGTAHIGLKCDGPLLRRAISLMLHRASNQAGERGRVQIVMEGGEALTLSVIAPIRGDKQQVSPWRFGSFCEHYCARIALMHEGHFATVCEARQYKQMLTIIRQAGPWPEG